jgi:hypothetical protein
VAVPDVDDAPSSGKSGGTLLHEKAKAAGITLD